MGAVHLANPPLTPNQIVTSARVYVGRLGRYTPDLGDALAVLDQARTLLKDLPETMATADNPTPPDRVALCRRLIFDKLRALGGRASCDFSNLPICKPKSTGVQIARTRTTSRRPRIRHCNSSLTEGRGGTMKRIRPPGPQQPDRSGLMTGTIPSMVWPTRHCGDSLLTRDS